METKNRLTAPRTVLLTGGAGFIGINLCHYWIKQYPNDTLIILDALTYAANRTALQDLVTDKKIIFYEGCIQDTTYCEFLFAQHPITHVIHAAAESHVDRSISDPDIFIKSNILGTHTLLTKAFKSWQMRKILCPAQVRFHHISTDEVYGSLNLQDSKFTEETPYDPKSPYSASKAASDHLVRAMGHTYGLPFTISNCSNNFGPYQHTEKLIPHMILKAIQGEKMPVYGKGKNIRDWLYVEDHCRAIDLILSKATPGETYLIGAENEWDNLSLVQKISEELKLATLNNPTLKNYFPGLDFFLTLSEHDQITFVQDRPGHDFRYAINPQKIQSLGFKTIYSFEKCLQATIKWYLDFFAQRKPTSRIAS